MSDRVLAPECVSAEPSVNLFTAPNPGPKTLEGTCTYVIGRLSTYVIDPGPDIPAHLTELAEWLGNYCQAVSAILLTHGHPDHALGARRLADSLGAPVWASASMPEREAMEAGVSRRYGSDQLFQVHDDNLEVISTPGHTPDHVALFLRTAGILFSGDHILGNGTTLIAPPEGNMTDYLRSLEVLRDLKSRIVAPGHGPLIMDPPSKFEEYFRHRHEREQQVLRELQDGAGDLDHLVTRIYSDVDPALWPLARGSLLAQIAKLEREGIVAEEHGMFHLTHAQ